MDNLRLAYLLLASIVFVMLPHVMTYRTRYGSQGRVSADVQLKSDINQDRTRWNQNGTVAGRVRLQTGTSRRPRYRGGYTYQQRFRTQGRTNTQQEYSERRRLRARQGAEVKGEFDVKQKIGIQREQYKWPKYNNSRTGETGRMGGTTMRKEYDGNARFNQNLDIQSEIRREGNYNMKDKIEMQEGRGGSMDIGGRYKWPKFNNTRSEESGGINGTTFRKELHGNANIDVSKKFGEQGRLDMKPELGGGRIDGMKNNFEMPERQGESKDLKGQWEPDGSRSKEFGGSGMQKGLDVDAALDVSEKLGGGVSPDIKPELGGSDGMKNQFEMPERQGGSKDLKGQWEPDGSRSKEFGGSGMQKGLDVDAALDVSEKLGGGGSPDIKPELGGSDGMKNQFEMPEKQGGSKDLKGQWEPDGSRSKEFGGPGMQKGLDVDAALDVSEKLGGGVSPDIKPELGGSDGMKNQFEMTERQDGSKHFGGQNESDMQKEYEGNVNIDVSKKVAGELKPSVEEGFGNSDKMKGNEKQVGIKADVEIDGEAQVSK